jgi:hypothetical protein
MKHFFWYLLNIFFASKSGQKWLKLLFTEVWYKFLTKKLWNNSDWIFTIYLWHALKNAISRFLLFLIFFSNSFHPNHIQRNYRNLVTSALSASLNALFDFCQFHQHFTHAFFVQKFCAKHFCTYILGLNFFWRKNIGANALIKCWWNWPQEVRLAKIP